MKGIRIGETSVFSEDGDGWEKLLEAMEKANKIYFKPIKGLEEKAGEEHWSIRLIKRVIRKKRNVCLRKTASRKTDMREKEAKKEQYLFTGTMFNPFRFGIVNRNLNRSLYSA